MKIGIEVQRLFRKKKHGMEVVALELLRQIREMEHNTAMSFVLFVKDDVDDQCIKPSKNLKIVRVPGYTYVDWEQYHLPRAVRKENIDVLHCTCNTAPLHLDIPIILTLHDIIYLESINFKGTFYQNFGNLYRRWLVPKLIFKCKNILTVSNYEKRNIIEKFQLQDNLVHVVYNGVNKKFKLIEDKKLLEDISAKYNLPEKFILFFGNTAPKKNTQRVLEAYQEYCISNPVSLPLVIIDYDIKNISSKIDQNVIDQLIILDFIPNDELPYFYNLAALFLYPSIRESFGMPILEAMACGTPVITSNTSAMPEIGGNAAIFVDPYNVAMMAKMIGQILSDANTYQMNIEAGLVNIKKYNWENVSRELINIYQKALD